MAAGLARKIPVQEYSPRKVKQSVTGNGSASKEQVAAMLTSIYGKFEMPTLDATDALAVATCHFYQKNNPANAGQHYSGWGSFIKNNPGRMG